MFSFQKPTIETIRRFLAYESKRSCTYSAVGATEGTPPAGYVVDHTRIKLGDGESVFHSASAALQRYHQCRLGWFDAWSPSSSIQAGEVVAVMGRAMGLWWPNSCRIVYVVNKTGPICKF